MILVDEVLQDQTPQSIDDVRRTLGSIARKAGCESFAYVGGKAFNPLSGGQAIWQEPPIMMIDFPMEWLQLYHENDYSLVDPAVTATLGNRLPTAWDIETPRNDVERLQRDFISQAHDFGLCRGLSIPIYGAMGDFGLLTFVSDEKSGGFDKTLRHYRHELHIAAIYLDQMVRKLAPTGIRPADLTEREIEVLCWTAAGKTSPEIAIILAISKKTVDFHIYNAMRKLDVYTKPQAVAKALLNGHINP
jgi:DNA-binding CsgD family transcriptional regulator